MAVAFGVVAPAWSGLARCGPDDGVPDDGGVCDDDVSDHDDVSDDDDGSGARRRIR